MKKVYSRTSVAIIFGWGGSSHKNVSKYSSIYYDTGCITVQYILPTRSQQNLKHWLCKFFWIKVIIKIFITSVFCRHLFRDTNQIPELMEHILVQLQEAGLHKNPYFIHCLCDTGVMCYQGMCRGAAKKIDFLWD